MCWEWVNSLVVYIVDFLVDVMFNKACMECAIKYFYCPGTFQTQVPFHWRNDVIFLKA